MLARQQLELGVALLRELEVDDAVVARIALAGSDVVRDQMIDPGPRLVRRRLRIGGLKGERTVDGLVEARVADLGEIGVGRVCAFIDRAAGEERRKEVRCAVSVRLPPPAACTGVREAATCPK